MRMKAFIILITFLSGFILSQCSEDGGSSTNTGSSGNSGSEGLTADTLNSDGGDIFKGSAPADDGSWVYILDDKIYKKKQFESTYHQFLQIAVTATGQTPQDGDDSKSMSRKKKIMEKIISVELAFKKAKADPFFKTQEGKNIVQVFYKQALFQYYLFKEVLSKVPEPGQDELKDFYKKNKKGFNARGVKGLETKKERSFVKMAYRNNKIQEGMAEHQGKLVNAYVIKGNAKVIEKYLAGEITKKMAYGDKGGKYWVVKVGKHKLTLDKVTNVIDLQIKSFKAEQSLKIKKGRSRLSEAMLQGLKNMELGYTAAVEKAYRKDPASKKFISLVQKSSIANYFLTKSILEKVKKLSNDEINEILKDKKKKKEYKARLKKLRYPVNKKYLMEYIRSENAYKQSSSLQIQFVKDLRESHRIIISEKYFKAKTE
ncbi:MAG: hypothetical protein IEMM0008_0267 [bacterium]|nr:MAG: hypothetical protein IEMM0008_0267 [bacterium]